MLWCCFTFNNINDTALRYLFSNKVSVSLNIPRKPKLFKHHKFCKHFIHKFLETQNMAPQLTMSCHHPPLYMIWF